MASVTFGQVKSLALRYKTSMGMVINGCIGKSYIFNKWERCIQCIVTTLENAVLILAKIKTKIVPFPVIHQDFLPPMHLTMQLG